MLGKKAKRKCSHEKDRQTLNRDDVPQAETHHLCSGFACLSQETRNGEHTARE